jgi:hypothetical protein
MTNQKHCLASALIGMMLLMALVVGCSRTSPEMKEVIDNFTDPSKREAVLNKYDAQSVVPEELTLCNMSKPVVSKTEKKAGIRYHTLESRVDECEHSPAAVGTVRVFVIGWKEGKITKFIWGGPKDGKVEY